MKSKKVFGVALIIIGAMLVLSAIGLVGYNYYESSKAGEASAEVLPDVKDYIENAKTDGVLPTIKPDIGQSGDEAATESEPVTEPSTGMANANFGGYDYIGVLSIPSLSLELPVMSDWDYARLKLAPCRYYGSVYTNDLVIAAHNYATHFGNLKNLKPSDLVIFTDMNGVEYKYEVICIDELRPNDISGMINGVYDLSLYTCTLGGRTRVTARCARIYD